MGYCTRDDLIGRYGIQIISQLTDRRRLGDADNTVLDDIIRDASSEIDAYLSIRYVTPLTDVPNIINKCCIDLVMYYLYGDKATDTVRKHYEDAIALLSRISTGKSILSNVETNTGTGVLTIKYTSGTNVWSRSVNGGL